MLQQVIHYSLHLIAPGLIAYIFFKAHWKRVWVILLMTMLVDIDHLYACKHMFPVAGGFKWMAWSHLLNCEHIFVPDRCSIGFHPLHSVWAIGFYAFMLFFPKLRIVAIGLLFHMLTDFLDCLWM